MEIGRILEIGEDLDRFFYRAASFLLDGAGCRGYSRFFCIYIGQTMRIDFAHFCSLR